MKYFIIKSIFILLFFSSCGESSYEKDCILEPQGSIAEDKINFTISSTFFSYPKAELVISGSNVEVPRGGGFFMWLHISSNGIIQELILTDDEGQQLAFPLETEAGVQLENNGKYIVHYPGTGLSTEKLTIEEYAPCEDFVEIND